MIDKLHHFIRPILLSFEAEQAQDILLGALRRGLVPLKKRAPNERLAQTVFGIRFTNPVGLAGGFDKNADTLGGLFSCGFGFIEAGPVTPLPQKGNPKPRLFFDPTSRSTINRLGFPNCGAEQFLQNYMRYRAGKRHQTGIVGFILGKQQATQDPAADYLTLIDQLAPFADYLVINISSPNTPDLRDLQKGAFLTPFLKEAKARATAACDQNTPTPPILLKLAPDLSDIQVDDIAEAILKSGIDGLVLTDTTLERSEKLAKPYAAQTGGLSGQPLRDKSTVMIRRFYKATNGKVPIIGAGGIANAQDAYTKIRAGACLIQIYSALIFDGPGVVNKIQQGLLPLLARDGFNHLSDAIGIDAK